VFDLADQLVCPLGEKYWLSMPQRTFYSAALLPADVLPRPDVAAAGAQTYRLFAHESAAAAWLAQY
jgi:hypothetical protein